VSQETLRKWMARAALWCPRAQRVKTMLYFVISPFLDTKISVFGIHKMPVRAHAESINTYTIYNRRKMIVDCGCWQVTPC